MTPLAAAALCAWLPARAASYPLPSPDAPGPRLQVHASRYYAVAPAQVTLYAHLSGVDDRDPRFCHVGEAWISGKVEPGGQLTSVSRHDPSCVHAAQEAHAETRFAKDYVFSRPGSYTCRLVISTNDGRILQSNLVTIVVR